MSRLIQLVYASRSQFPSAKATGSSIEPAIARILVQSRIKNAREGLVGALYYGDGCFFQVLQGDEGQVDALYARLQRDTRHSDLRILDRREIRRQTFRSWSMKYVPLAGEVTALLRSRRLDRFDPYRFDDELVAAMLGLLQGADDFAPGASQDPIAQLARIEDRRHLEATRRLAYAACAVAGLAFLLAGIGWFAS